MRIPTGGVGFFDSGVGGLTVLRECLPFLRGRNVYYYGDNARAPYGGRSEAEIRAFTFECFEAFKALNVCAAVIACNTVTSVCAEELRRRYSFPVIGTEPAIFPAARKGGSSFVLATRTTVESARFHILLARARAAYPQAKLFPFACEGLAAAVEDGVERGSFSEVVRFLPNGSPDSVVLGCTHYGFLRSLVEAHYGCPVFDGAKGVAKRLHGVLSSLDRVNFSSEREMEAERGIYVFADEKTNVCLRNNGKNDPKNGEMKGFFDVFFLGSGKSADKKAYEQMFVL